MAIIESEMIANSQRILSNLGEQLIFLGLLKDAVKFERFANFTASLVTPRNSSEKTCSQQSQQKLGLILFYMIMLHYRIVTAALRLQCIINLMSHPNFFLLRVSLRDLLNFLNIQSHFHVSEIVKP